MLTRCVPIVGDLAKPFLGVHPNDRAKLKGKIKHFFHLAAVYDIEQAQALLIPTKKTDTQAGAPNPNPNPSLSKREESSRRGWYSVPSALSCRH